MTLTEGKGVAGGARRRGVHPGPGAPCQFAGEKEFVARRRAYEARFHRLIGEGIGLGILRPTDVKVATFALLGAMNHTTRWYRPEGRLGARAIGIQFAEMLVAGLLADGQTLAVPSPELIERDFSAAAE